MPAAVSPWTLNIEQGADHQITKVLTQSCPAGARLRLLHSRPAQQPWRSGTCWSGHRPPLAAGRGCHSDCGRQRHVRPLISPAGKAGDHIHTGLPLCWVHRQQGHWMGTSSRGRSCCAASTCLITKTRLTGIAAGLVSTLFGFPHSSRMHTAGQCDCTTSTAKACMTYEAEPCHRQTHIKAAS